MTTPNLTDAIEAVVTSTYERYSPSARKTGRNPRWPYVPVVIGPPGSGPGDNDRHHRQVLGKAFATRAEAVAYAARVIAHHADSMRRRLADPRHRAERRQYGLPEEVTA